jgi:hypothetical protein
MKSINPILFIIGEIVVGEEKNVRQIYPKNITAIE